MRHLLLVLGCVGWASACGGTVVVDEGGDGGAGANGTGATGTGATGTGASGNSGTGATGTGGTGASGGSGGAPVSCTTHEECAPSGMVCIFGTGTCAPACDGGFCADCGPGSVCDGCATSSCPDCLDCMAACVPITPGRCDETDPCPEGQSCDWGSSFCQSLCGPNGSCPPGTSCIFCATGSCCGCDDCVDLCYEFDGAG